MRLGIKSDGTRKGNRIINTKTGEEVEGVVGIEWKWSYEEGETVPYCVLTIEAVPIDAVMIDPAPEKETL